MSLTTKHFELAAVFLKLGLFGFGGPAAHLALMHSGLTKKENVFLLGNGFFRGSLAIISSMIFIPFLYQKFLCSFLGLLNQEGWHWAVASFWETRHVAFLFFGWFRNMELGLSFVAVALGLAALVWSANKFIDGAAQLSRHFGVDPLIIGMVIIGFGTSAPEMFVSAIASFEGNPGVALGNAYGSNIINVALIVGLTAFLKPIVVHSQVIRKEIPLLLGYSVLTVFLLSDLFVSRADALVLLGVFALTMLWTFMQAKANKKDEFGLEVEQELNANAKPLRIAVIELIFGFVFLLISSRILVWGSVRVASFLGVDDVIIGLTIVAAGTSLPELISSVIAAKKGESDLALGNVIGSNLFNTLSVVGLAGVIHPMAVAPEILYRDVYLMVAFTVVLLFVCFGFRQQGTITRVKGFALMTGYVAYLSYLVTQTF